MFNNVKEIMDYRAILLAAVQHVGSDKSINKSPFVDIEELGGAIYLIKARDGLFSSPTFFVKFVSNQNKTLVSSTGVAITLTQMEQSFGQLLVGYETCYGVQEIILEESVNAIVDKILFNMFELFFAKLKCVNDLKLGVSTDIHAVLSGKDIHGVKVKETSLSINLWVENHNGLGVFSGAISNHMSLPNFDQRSRPYNELLRAGLQAALFVNQNNWELTLPRAGCLTLS